MTRYRSFAYLLFIGMILAACSLSFGSRAATADELFVADRATDRVLSFDPVTGAFNRVVLDEGLVIPSSLAVSPYGDLFVGNAGTGQVLKVDPVTGDAEVFATIGGVGGLYYDAGALPDDSDDQLFVSEFTNFSGDEVYRFDADGNQIGDPIGTGSGNTGRSGVVLRNGDLYVNEFAAAADFFTGSVLKFDGASNFEEAPTVIATDPRLGWANGLAFDEAGQLYVGGLLTQLALGPEAVPVFKFDISDGPAMFGQLFGVPMAYPSAILIDDENGTEVAYLTSLGNDNPMDPVYGTNFFPGAIYKLDVATGTLIGGAPLVSSGGVSDHDDDGVVDGDDLAEWEAAFGSDSDADADSDDDSDGADFLSWQRNLGKLGDFQPTAVALYETMVIAQPVPEPASWAIGAALAISYPTLRRLRRRQA